MKIYDFITKKKKLIKDKDFTFYLCGPTVYDDLHIGNIRPILTYDLVIRYLIEKKIPYKYISNITDIDDKIIKKAMSENKTELEIASKYIEEYLELLKKYNVIFPTKMPKVTDNLEGIIGFIKKLIQKNYAYENQQNVFLNIKKVKNYGSMVNLKSESLVSEGDEFINLKQNSHDFVLWKNTSVGIKYDSF